MTTKERLRQHLDGILKQIEQAALSVGRRPDDIRLIAASKSRTVEELLWFQEEICARGRPALFGENYIQEYRAKAGQLSGSFQSHFIGHLQSNKAREAVALFDVIESVDSPKRARVIAKEAYKAGKKQVIYLQVNISSDSKKSGFSEEELQHFIEHDLPSLDMLQVEGLMTITAQYDSPDMVRKDYRRMRHIRDALLETYPGVFASRFCHLSMGMSDDFQIAIEEGATAVRIGSALFGART